MVINIAVVGNIPQSLVRFLAFASTAIERYGYRRGWFSKVRIMYIVSFLIMFRTPLVWCPRKMWWRPKEVVWWYLYPGHVPRPVFGNGGRCLFKPFAGRNVGYSNLLALCL